MRRAIEENCDYFLNADGIGVKHWLEMIDHPTRSEDGGWRMAEDILVAATQFLTDRHYE